MAPRFVHTSNSADGVDHRMALSVGWRPPLPLHPDSLPLPDWSVYQGYPGDPAHPIHPAPPVRAGLGPHVDQRCPGFIPGHLPVPAPVPLALVLPGPGPGQHGQQHGYQGKDTTLQPLVGAGHASLKPDDCHVMYVQRAWQQRRSL